MGGSSKGAAFRQTADMACRAARYWSWSWLNMKLAQ